MLADSAKFREFLPELLPQKPKEHWRRLSGFPDVWIPEVGLRVGDQRAMNRRGIKSSEINRGFADGWNRACAGNFLKPNVRVELKFSWSLCSQMSQGFAVEGDGPKSLGGKLRGDGFEALWVTAIAGIGLPASAALQEHATHRIRVWPTSGFAGNLLKYPQDHLLGSNTARQRYREKNCHRRTTEHGGSPCC